MLRQVFITKDGEIIYKRDFGKGLDQDGFNQAYRQISGEAFKLAVENIKYHDFFKYRIGYLSVPEHKLIFMFVSDLSDKFNNVKKELERCRKEFLDLFSAILDEQLDEDTFEIFDPTIELIHKNLRPKISLVGFSGVGKTTITRLITAEDIPMEHVPTITGDIGTIKIGKLHFHLWDFAGQEQFSFLWNNFIKGSDAVLLITDSTLENCEKSKYFIELIKKEAPYSHTAAIGNKQDLPDAMPIADIERHLGMKAYSMIATDPDNRDKMITIIADILEMSGEVSPLLKPLLERDKILKEAENAVESGDFAGAVQLFEKLADLSIELGDDRVSQDFNEKAQKIRGILQKMGQSPTPAPTIQATPTISHPEESNINDNSPQITPVTEAGSSPESIPSAPPIQPVSPPPIQPVSPPPIQPVNPPPQNESTIPPPAPPSKTPTTSTTDTVESQASPIPPMNESMKTTQANLVKPVIPGKPVIKPLPTEDSAPIEEMESPKPSPIPPVSVLPIKKEQEDQLDKMLSQIQAPPPAPPKAPSPPTSVLNADSAYATPVEAKPLNSHPTPPTPKSTPVPPQTTPVTPNVQPSTSVSTDQTKLITELKIKIANVNKTLLDLEMDNITGDLSDEEFEAKSARLTNLKGKLEQQIKELSSI
jgi:small GTP-binding protein